jgi:hypothetical protein
MAKPTQTAAWATDANYTGGAEAGTPTKVEPTAGKKTEGFEPAEEPAAQSLNWWQNLVGTWTAWLNGIVAGAEARLVQRSAAGDLSASNTLAADVTFNGITSNGTIKFTGTRTLIISAAAAYPSDTGAAWTFSAGEFQIPDTTYLNYPITIESGCRITEYTVFMEKNTNSSGVLWADLCRRHKTGSAVEVLQTVWNDGNAVGDQPLTQLGFTHDVDPDYGYWIRAYSVGIGASTDKFRHALVKFSQPA